jgi:hypothetical protein
MATLTATQVLNNSSAPLLNTTGGIIRMQLLEYSPNVGISGSSGSDLFSVTYTKLLSATQSNLIIESYIWGHGASAGVCGPYISVAGSRNYNHTYTYEGGQGNTPIFGMSWWTSVAAGAVTITAGWSTNNGEGGNQPFTTLNTNQGQGDSRYRKKVSRILVMEVLK